MLDEDLSTEKDVQFCSGCFFVIRTEAFQKLGGFDRRYFMYVEDADLTQEALQLGRVVYWPGTQVVHAWHRSPSRHLSSFFQQLRSMGIYFKNGGSAGAFPCGSRPRKKKDKQVKERFAERDSYLPAGRAPACTR